MNRNLVKQLKGLKHEAINPRGEWEKKNRELLLSQINNTLPEKPEVLSAEAKMEKMWAGLAVFLPRPFVYNVVRPIAVLVLVALVATTAYSGTVKASADTLPGDFLYSAKRTAERAEGAVITLIGDGTSETKYHVKMAERRATEAQKIVKKKDDPQKAAKVSAAVQDLKNEMKTINAKLEDKENKQDLQADVAKDVKINTEAIQSALQEVKQELILTGSTGTIKQVTDEVAETKNMVQDVSVKAVEVMVAKHLEGDQSVSKEEVKQVIDTTITSAASQALDSKQTIVGANTMIETMKTQVKDLAKEIKAGDLSTSTKEFSAKLTDMVSSTKDAAAKSEVASAQVDKMISEARVAVNNGDLSTAVDKLREVNAVAQETEKIMDATIVKAQEVLPIVQVIKDVGVPIVSATSSLLTVSSTKDIISLISSSTVLSVPLNAPTGTLPAKPASSTTSTVK